MMDKTTLCTAIVVAVIIISMGAVIVYDNSLQDDESSGSTYNLVARVNSEGSGIYIKDTVLTARGGSSAFFTNNSGYYTVDESNAAAWGGLIFATPGAATIQHVQLQSLVEEKMKLGFTLYQEGQSTDNKHVYFVTNIANKAAAEAETHIDGGILWEPQFSAIVENNNGFVELGLTNNFFPGHTCCVIAGYTSYMQSHPDTTARFLAAYIKGAEWISDPANHEELVTLCMEKTSGLSRTAIEDALSNITYVYSDESGDLNDLRKDVANLVTGLSPGLKRSISELGFNSPNQFASRFVDDSYLMKALEINSDDSYSYSGSKASITVACISGDIHQIALHAAVAQGYFAEYGINVSISAQSNGPGVATALQNGEAQFGLMGAPPATSTVINGKLVTN